jgi:hypothetical protein
MTGSRVDRQSCRFIYDYNIRVLINDVKRDILRHEYRRFRRGNQDLYFISAFEFAGRALDEVIHGNITVLNELLNV